MLRRQWLASLAVMALAAAGCGGGDDGISGTGRFSVTGQWAGAATIGQYSNFRLNITQAANGAITGTWTAQQAAGGGLPPLDQSGNAFGANNANAISITLQEIAGGGTFTGTANSTSRMTGTIAVGAGAPVAVTFNRQ